MCGLFGAHKSHKMSTTTELESLNDDIIEKARVFLKQSVDVEQLKTCESYSEYLQGKGKARIRVCRNMAQKMYEVGLLGD